MYVGQNYKRHSFWTRRHNYNYKWNMEIQKLKQKCNIGLTKQWKVVCVLNNAENNNEVMEIQ